MNMKIKGSILEDGERYILKGCDNARGKPICYDIIFQLRKGDFYVIMIKSGKGYKILIKRGDIWDEDMTEQELLMVKDILFKEKDEEVVE